ncbi:MAG: hypothetical protein JRF72_16675 [Deltaproteobacteria bacterium]|jgi:hypothetical protein|nr:hypothetical protein [Deltaproteobacteria bacterium]
MHVKWQRLKLKSGFNGATNHLVALLVDKSANEAPKHDGLHAELGTIKEQYLQTKATNAREFHQGLFWAAVDKKLDLLALSPDVRNRIEQQILKEVPRPGEDWALWGVTCIPRYDP